MPTSETGTRRVPVTTGISNGSKTADRQRPRGRPAGHPAVTRACYDLPAELFGQVFSSLLRNKLRSFLTMAGIAWGVASMVLIVAMGDGFKVGQRDRFRELGENIVDRLQRPHRKAGRRAARRDGASGSPTTTCAISAPSASWCAASWPNCRTPRAP